MYYLSVMRQMGEVLNMVGIKKRFPGVLALDDVHIDLKKGEVHVLLGENGAGKSTLMKILSGAYQKDEGRIYIDGIEVEIDSPGHAQELGISIIYQEFNLNSFMSVAENIFMGREPENFPGIINWKKLFQDSQVILDSLNVGIDARTEVGTLGVAKQQMVEVAKALSFDSQILIMDEPTASLANNEIKQLFKTIDQLKEDGVAIIYISHRLEEIYQIGDRVTILRDGNHIATKNVADTTQDQLVTMMVDRKLDDHIPKISAKIGDVVLKLENVSANSRLNNISLELRKGEILGIAGLMGSGRTRLAKTIFGAETISSGQIIIGGKPVQLNLPRDAIDAGLGLVTEDRKGEGLILDLSVKKNICLANINQFVSNGILNLKKEMSVTDRYIDVLNIRTPNRNQLVVNLSGGNQQKVVLSKWLCTDANILIFDEPTRGIDVGAKTEIYQIMNQLTAKGVAIIMISSEMPEILGMSDRIIVMRKGSISGELTRKEATQEKIMNLALEESHEAVA